jgi:serine/threonine protein kinase
MSPRGAAKLIEWLARTVGNFHRLNPPIVHRDLKPANILVTTGAEGRIGLKISDFGIGGLAAGREIERSQTRPSAGGASCSIARGSYTPLYTSPEQVRGAEPDPRDDVHALGVIWFQLLSGDIAHGAPTGLDWTEDLEAKGMTREQIGVLASCFSSRRERRPTDGAALAEKMDALFDLRRRGAPEPPKPQFTARGPLERLGKSQWNVLVRNAEEMRAFWARHRIDTKLDWAGTSPPKATVSRGELVARCDDAGEGAEVEYDLEVEDRATGRGVSGVGLRVLSPPRPEGISHRPDPPERTPSGDVPGAPEGGLSFDDVVARLVADGGRPGKTATAGSYHATASKLRFVPCRCSWGDPTYGSHEYIARSARGKAYYVSHNLRTGLITCGPNGYHFCRPNVPECI